jgi:hypothetical protein
MKITHRASGYTCAPAQSWTPQAVWFPVLTDKANWAGLNEHVGSGRCVADTVKKNRAIVPPPAYGPTMAFCSDYVLYGDMDCIEPKEEAENFYIMFKSGLSSPCHRIDRFSEDGFFADEVYISYDSVDFVADWCGNL